MGSVVNLLLEWMDHTFVQEGWHVSLLDSITGVSAAQAAWVPARERNSIWKIVEHVALWKEEGARRILAQPPRPAGWEQGYDWREIGPVSEERWQTAGKRLRDAHAAVKAALAKRSDADLQVPAPGSALPIAATVRGLILHDSYHCGQICYLRALAGNPAKIW
ncbi:MAG TPA: DinB family protein [bacterium]|nr:DinB family protein [bacterium]